ncbi:MAG: M23 family metallopeptidase [Candidatus Aminicenantes bacterium]|nr:M23 family metallopeptidase [Candidatus Aminicenantes bacterium]
MIDLKIGRKSIWAAVVLLLTPAFGGQDAPALRTFHVPGVALEFTCRALQPGEVILVKSRNDPTVRRIDVRLRTQKRRFDFDAGTGTALLGIDYGAKPQAYFMEIGVERRDGSRENLFHKLVVEPRDFPQTKLTVAPGMVNPPPEEAERIRRESVLVADLLAAVSPSWLGSGPFVSPLPGFEPFPNFGQKRIYNGRIASTHSGVDISAPAGTAARAANSGRVVLATGLYYSGKTVIIDHGLGVFTYYCHFSKLRVKRGDRVAKGDIIAEVGSTGRSTGPHLHWSVRVLDSRVDPWSLAALPLD